MTRETKESFVVCGVLWLIAMSHAAAVVWGLYWVLYGISQ